jgi:hypothetical protein
MEAVMPEERRKILEMLAAGRICIDDAEHLLDESECTRSCAQSEARDGSGALVGPGSKPKYLRVLVEETDDKNVNIRVPLVLIQAGLKLAAMLPNEAQEALRGHGVDLSQLGDLKREDLIEALGDLRIDVTGNGGKKIRVFSE